MDKRTPDDQNVLNRRLDRAVPPHSTTVGDADADPLVRTAQRVAQGPDVALSDAAVDRIEARLFAQIETMLLRVAPASGMRKRSHWRRWALRYATAAVLSLVLILVSVAQSSASSLPGDRLYSVKRAIEDVRLSFVSEEDEAALRVSLAERRINEFETLLERGEIHIDTLEEANDELAQALDLVERSGDWTEVETQLRSVADRQADLIDQVVRDAGESDESENTRLETVSARTSDIQQRIKKSVPPDDPDHPGNGHGANPDNKTTPPTTPEPATGSTAPPDEANNANGAKDANDAPNDTPRGTPANSAGQNGVDKQPPGNGKGTPADPPGKDNPNRGGASQAGEEHPTVGNGN